MKIANQSLHCRNGFLIVVIFSAGISFCAQLYTYFFYEALITGDVHGAIGFANIVVSDTFFYKKILQNIINDTASFSWLLQTKNYSMPVLMWYLSGDDWSSIALLNGVLIFFAFLYFIKICKLFNLNLNTKIFVIYIGISPIFIYYSIGGLKELPCLLGILGFIYHYLKHHKVNWIFYFLLIIFTRQQLIIPLVLFLIIDKTFKNQLMASVITLLIAGGLYPFFEHFYVLEINATLQYRVDQEGSAGAEIESIRSSIPILSSIAVLLRVIQSIFEPTITFIKYLTVYQDNDLSVYLFVNLLQNIVLTPLWLLTMVGIVNETFFRKNKNINTRRLYAFIVLYVGSVGGFSFIHHRYLFPIIGLITIGGFIASERVPDCRNFPVPPC